MKPQNLATGSAAICANKTVKVQGKMAFFSQNADLMSGFQTSKLPEMDEDNHSDALEREVMHSGRFWQILSRNK